VNAKKLCNKNGHSYTEVVIGEDISVEDFKAKYPDVRTVPFITMNESAIGGYLQLEEFLNQTIS